MIVHAALLPAGSHGSQLTELLIEGMPPTLFAWETKAFLDGETQAALQQEYDLYLLTPLRRNMKPIPFAMPAV
jgi:hypothetical protein